MEGNLYQTQLCKFLLGLVLVFLLQVAHSVALPAKDFYKFPLHPFKSGQANQDLLSANRIKSQTISMSLVEVGSLQEWIPSNEVIKIKVFDLKKENLRGEISFLKNTVISYKKNNQFNWVAYKKIKRGQFFEVKKLIGAWACGYINEEYLCVGNQDLIIKTDFALKALIAKAPNQDTWVNVLERSQDQVTTTTGEKINWNTVKQWHYSQPNETENEIAFIHPESKSKIKGTLVPFEKIKIKKEQIHHWVESFIPQHGKVWWNLNLNDNTNIFQSAEKENQLIISSEDLKNRGVYDWDTDAKKISIAAANGIFISEEKDTWKFLPEFGEKNYPVAVSNNESLFIGDKYSKDKGKTFNPYIRWDKVTEFAQRELEKTPEQLQITKIHIPKKFNYVVFFEVNTGDKKLTFKTHLETHQVQLIEKF